MKVKIGFSYQDKWLSKLIRWATNSPVSHSYIRDISDSEDLVIHAHGLNVSIVPYDIFSIDNKVVKEFEYDMDEQSLSWLYDQTTKSYGVLTLLGFVWVMLGKKLGKQWKNPFSDNNKSFVCSELVAKSIGMENAEGITPFELLNYFENK